MRVLLANKFFYDKGGAETVFFQERQWLLGNGHEVADFSMHHPKNLPSWSSQYFTSQVDYVARSGVFKKLLTGVNFVHNFEAVNNVRKLCDSFRPQIAHLHNIYHQLTPSIIPTLKEKGAKIVLTVHDGKLVCPAYVMMRDGKPCTDCSGRRYWNAALTNCKQSRAESLLLAIESLFHRFRDSYGHVDRIISPSKFLADLVIEAGFPAERVVVVKNGIDVNELVPARRDEGYALYYGRLSHEKGLNTLCAASREFNMPLRVVGTGPLLESLRVEFSDVHFDGFLSGQQLRDAIQGARCVVVPSEWYENCSMVVLESMALAKPVIGSHIGGIPEQVLDGQTGFLFSPGNVSELVECVNRLANEPQLAAELGRGARTRLEDVYSLDRHFSSIDRVFQELLS